MTRHLLHPRASRRAVCLVGAVVLLGGCSDALSDPGSIDSSSAPVDATSQAFCDAYDVAGGLDPAADDDDLAVGLRADAVTLIDVGTPDDIPEPARAGFVVYVAATARVTADEARALVGATSPGQVATALGIDADDTGDTGDTDAITAFRSYVAGTCFTGL